MRLEASSFSIECASIIKIGSSVSKLFTRKTVII